MKVESYKIYSWKGKELEDVFRRLGVNGTRLESISASGTGGEPYLKIKMEIEEDEYKNM